MTNASRHESLAVLPGELLKLARRMRCAAGLLRHALPDEAEASQHADELDGAAGKVDQWIEEIRKPG